jgi:hypothetical protein
MSGDWQRMFASWWKMSGTRWMVTGAKWKNMSSTGEDVWYLVQDDGHMFGGIWLIMSGRYLVARPVGWGGGYESSDLYSQPPFTLPPVCGVEPPFSRYLAEHATRHSLRQELFNGTHAGLFSGAWGTVTLFSIFNWNGKHCIKHKITILHRHGRRRFSIILLVPFPNRMCFEFRVIIHVVAWTLKELIIIMSLYIKEHLLMLN